MNLNDLRRKALIGKSAAERAAAAVEYADQTLAKASEPFREIVQRDVGSPKIQAFGRQWDVEDFIGEIKPKDVGKRIYLRGDILQVENDDQRNAREGRKAARPAMRKGVRYYEIRRTMRPAGEPYRPPASAEELVRGLWGNDNFEIVSEQGNVVYVKSNGAAVNERGSGATVKVIDRSQVPSGKTARPAMRKVGALNLRDEIKGVYSGLFDDESLVSKLTDEVMSAAKEANTLMNNRSASFDREGGERDEYGMALIAFATENGLLNGKPYKAVADAFDSLSDKMQDASELDVDGERFVGGNVLHR